MTAFRLALKIYADCHEKRQNEKENDSKIFLFFTVSQIIIYKKR